MESLVVVSWYNLVRLPILNFIGDMSLQLDFCSLLDYLFPKVKS